MTLFQYVVSDLMPGGYLYWLIVAPMCHFALSAFAGALVYWLTSTILSHGRSTTHWGRISLPDSGIRHYSLLLSLSFSVLVHILEDYIVKVF